MDNTTPKILIVEDELTVCAGLEENLRCEGYEVFSYHDGVSGLDGFRSINPDLVILDVMVPGLDGFEVCRQIRLTKRATPIIILTAKGEEVDKVVGLEIGADDYLTKPFGMRELFARVKALLRRVKNFGIESATNANGKELETLTFSDVSVDFRTYRASRDGKEVVLSAKEFELLRFLASRPDVPLTRDQLLDHVWGYNSYPSTRTVDNFIARLRHKIEKCPDKPRHILTVHGVGYKFVH